jgi:hypothetical protein
MSNLREASRLCREVCVPLVLDAWAVRRDESSERGRPVADIAREACPNLLDV